MRRLRVALLTAAASAASLAAQCSNVLLDAGKQLGTNDAILATTTWDPDGNGPLPEQIIVGGAFTIAGGVQAQHVAAFNPATNLWEPLGAGFDQPVFALATLPNGDLVAGGGFQSSGGQPTGSVARWNGTAWVPFAGGVLGFIWDLEVTSSGTLLIAGCPTQAGGVPVGKIAAWDGSSWSTFGTGLNGIVRQVSEAPNGDVVALGEFTAAGGQFARRIARWDGTSWSEIGGGLVASDLSAMRHLSTGELLIGGRNMRSFPISGFNGSAIGMWDGTSWSIPFGLAPDFSRSVGEILERPNGDIVLVGDLPSLAGFSNPSIAVWDGSNWASVSTAVVLSSQSNNVTAITETASGELIAAGDFLAIDGTNCNNIATLPATGTAWQAVGDGLAGFPRAIAVDANGDLLLAGEIQAAGLQGQTSGDVTRWDGVTWQPLGTGPLPGSTHAIAVAPNGDVVIAGTFEGSQPGNFVSLQRWDGTAWSTFAPNTAGTINQLVALPNGDFIAGGKIFAANENAVALYDGSSWTSLGTLNASSAGGQILAMAVMPTGELVVGGFFSDVAGVPANSCAIWDGANWSPLDLGFNGLVFSLLATPDRQLYAGGSFTTAGGLPANRIARWDGQQWQPLGLGMSDGVWSIEQLPNGDVIAAGQFEFAGMVPASAIARWDGASWSEFVDGAANSVRPPLVTATRFVNDRLAIAGDFTSVDSQRAHIFALVGTTCPADVTTLGGGCVGSAGPHVLESSAQPWLGTTFVTTASAMPANSLAVGVYGGATAPVPLSSLLPQGVVGCDLRTTPDVLQALVPAAGSASSSLALPATVALAGFNLRHQVVVLELSASASLFAATITNALSITLGAF